MADPIAMPDIVGWEEVEFDPVRPRDLDRMEGRRTEAQSFGTAYWTGRWRPGRLDLADYGKMDAFMMSAGDDGEAFRAHDPFRPRPIAHDTGQPLSGLRAAGGVFDGTATLSAIIDSRTVTISGLPAAFQVRRGDYVEFRMSPWLVSLHRVMADTAADGNGVATLSIKYGLDQQHFTTAAVVNLEKPSCIMQIDPGSWQGVKALRARRPMFRATEVFFTPEVP